ncbi:MAG: hypothetical protein QOD29_5318 [Alphaproteobacteria bacterium]|jgi:NADPH:quinone reductase-like Zn-dependent oxidoreductase|nr:hypothetical protein [Alphaproteobacteria bacterium]
MHKTRPGAPRSLAGKAFFIAIQIAKAFGAEVFATDSEPKRDYIEQVGATLSITAPRRSMSTSRAIPGNRI